MAVLVGYASAHGSTRSIADRIAATLAEQGRHVEIQSMDQVQDADGYEAFVLGSAIHDRSWLIEGIDFVVTNQDVLARRPVWLFSVGMPAALRGPWRTFADKEEAQVSARLKKEIAPRGHRLFSGVIRREHQSFLGNLIFKAMGCRYGDYRDWAQIDAWAAGITRDLATVQPRRRPYDPDVPGR